MACRCGGLKWSPFSLNHIVYAPDCLVSVDLTSITWLVFTSDNGVRAFFSGLLNKQCDIRSCKNARILAIGPKTRAAPMAHGVTPDLMPEVATSEGVIATLKQTLSTRDHVLIPTSSEADDALLDLRTTGATVTKISVYQSCPQGYSNDDGLDSSKRYNDIYERSDG